MLTIEYVLEKYFPVSQVKKYSRVISSQVTAVKKQARIAQAENRAILRADIEGCELLGVTDDGKDIYLYRYKGYSSIIRELGRLREIAFRAVGEGSNKSRDIDEYDKTYLHLILWDKRDTEIVGSYRLGDAKHLVKKDKNELYTASLFTYNEAMTPYFEQGLELGRSFVQPKYWGKRSLDYLWYGIGAYLKKYPNYRYLFGAVSLSDTFSAEAKKLLVSFYDLYFGEKEEMVQSRSPFIIDDTFITPFAGTSYKEDFSILKHELAVMGFAIPTLYKQYTEVCEPGGVTFLGFNVDANFNDCIDGLMLMDIAMLKKRKRQRYLPNSTLERF